MVVCLKVRDIVERKGKRKRLQVLSDEDCENDSVMNSKVNSIPAMKTYGTTCTLIEFINRDGGRIESGVTTSLEIFFVVVFLHENETARRFWQSRKNNINVYAKSHITTYR